ncbi:ferric iron reductase [Muricoccus pecuniae]|uniref:Ferric iron reductase protein FhuF n=1 Tax=Muricoccus pecuniae TaxID=693023 RepID=A0A840XZH0_9PROT|nr:ferric iron reductase [Roseomonas pecuniae]MBB5691999.1 ferric iron reductase protein FhuF [Roseomonas pecuniae]
MDRKAGAAFFLSHLALALLHPVAAMAALHGVVPLLHGNGAALRAEFHDWQHAGRSGRAVRLHLLVDPGCRTTAPEGEEALRLAIHDLAIALLSPVIPALHRASGLSAGALWRIVADMACLAFLRVGEVLGEDEAQRGRAIGVTRRPGSPLNNGRSGFLHVALHAPETARLIAERWFLQRGGCCRYYTFSDGQKCPTCVLRPEAEQRAILAEHLAALHAPG